MAANGERPGSRWRLALSSLAFVFWAPPTFLGLPLAALLLLAGPRTTAQRATALLLAVPSVVWLATIPQNLLGAAACAYGVLVTGAFVVLVLLAPARFLTQALRASVIALGAGAVLARTVLGADAGNILQWEARRQGGEVLQILVQLRPEAYAVVEPAVQFLGATIPAFLVLQAMAGLGLAWQWHHALTPRPLGAPLAPFGEFRFADAWVWAVVAAIGVWITPVVAGLKGAALNLLVVLGALYLLRGAAIVVAFAGVLGVAPGTLVFALAASAVLAVPLLFVIPGLATLGMTDTWLEFRRRLAGRPNAS